MTTFKLSIWQASFFMNMKEQQGKKGKVFWEQFACSYESHEKLQALV